uniref:Uncharacterized protein n=1 Tax=Mustela putorius furo TaxID=9669 RepID=M3Z1L5_MUSPF
AARAEAPGALGREPSRRGAGGGRGPRGGARAAARAPTPCPDAWPPPPPRATPLPPTPRDTHRAQAHARRFGRRGRFSGRANTGLERLAAEQLGSQPAPARAAPRAREEKGAAPPRASQPLGTLSSLGALGRCHDLEKEDARLSLSHPFSCPFLPSVSVPFFSELACPQESTLRLPPFPEEISICSRVTNQVAAALPAPPPTSIHPPPGRRPWETRLLLQAALLDLDHQRNRLTNVLTCLKGSY